MNRQTSNAVQMTNREFFQQRESAALCRIPGVRELLRATAEQRPMLEQKYPDAVFALQIISNPFIRTAKSVQFRWKPTLQFWMVRQFPMSATSMIARWTPM